MFLRCLLTGLAVSLALAGCTKPSVPGGAIKVNGQVFTHTEIMQAAEILRESIVATSPEKAVEGISTKLLAGAAHQLIANHLLIQEAKNRGFTASQPAVDSAYQQLRSRFPDQASFVRELTKAGETDSSFRAKISDGMYMQSLLTSLLATITPVSNKACTTFYEQHKTEFRGKSRYRVSQIFLPFTDTLPDSKKQLVAKMNDIRQKIVAGKSFSECATSYSKGPGSTEGGDIGWFAKGDLRADLDTPLAPLKTGELSQTVVSETGAHLLQKTAEESESIQPFEVAEKRIRFILELQERNNFVRNHVDSLISRAKITYYDESLRMSRDSLKSILFSDPVN